MFSLGPDLAKSVTIHADISCPLMITAESWQSVSLNMEGVILEPSTGSEMGILRYEILFGVILWLFRLHYFNLVAFG